jgi:hypothetical protein
MLCYATLSRRTPLRMHGDSFRDGSEISLNSPENQCRMGFQPLLIGTIERRFPRLPFFRVCTKIRVKTLGSRLTPGSLFH